MSRKNFSFEERIPGRFGCVDQDNLPKDKDGSGGDSVEPEGGVDSLPPVPDVDTVDAGAAAAVLPPENRPGVFSLGGQEGKACIHSATAGSRRLTLLMHRTF